MESSAAAPAALRVQQALWSAHLFFPRPDAFAALEQLGALIAAPELAPFDRRARRLEKMSSVTLVLGFCLGAVAVLHAAALVVLFPAWVLSGSDLWPATRVVLVSLLVVVGLFFLWLLLSLALETVLTRVDVRLARLRRPERLRAIAWTHVELEAVPVSVLVDPAFADECLYYPELPTQLLVDELWSRLGGVDRQTMEVLAKESDLSLELARRAAHALN